MELGAMIVSVHLKAVDQHHKDAKRYAEGVLSAYR